jgi:hypothetical protein
MMRRDPLGMSARLLRHLPQHERLEQLPPQFALLVEISRVTWQEAASQPCVTEVQFGSLDQSLGAICEPRRQELNQENVCDRSRPEGLAGSSRAPVKFRYATG